MQSNADCRGEVERRNPRSTPQPASAHSKTLVCGNRAVRWMDLRFGTGSTAGNTDREGNPGRIELELRREGPKKENAT